MHATDILPQTDLKGQTQETHAEVQFSLPTGPHFNADIGEYEVWDNGEVIAYASTEGEAWRIYHEELEAQRVHFERCPGDAILWTRIPFEGEPCYTRVLAESDQYGLEARG